jgi:hypothetical protein
MRKAGSRIAITLTLVAMTWTVSSQEVKRSIGSHAPRIQSAALADANTLATRQRFLEMCFTSSFYKRLSTRAEEHMERMRVLCSHASGKREWASHATREAGVKKRELLRFRSSRAIGESGRTAKTRPTMKSFTNPCLPVWLPSNSVERLACRQRNSAQVIATATAPAITHTLGRSRSFPRGCCRCRTFNKS